MPLRGSIEKIGIPVEASPVSRPCQYGELADSASSSGRYSRIPSSARTARSIEVELVEPGTLPQRGQGGAGDRPARQPGVVTPEGAPLPAAGS
jgi:hypothetical protein